MCIIAIKKAGVKFPKMETIKTICKNNPDGFSMVYKTFADDSKPVVFKTLDESKFLEAYKIVSESLDYRSVNLFIHARIKTHGTKRIENCHGWTENDLTFAHNGILKIDNRDDMTDSETFFRDIFSPIYKHCGFDAAKKAIDAVIGTSKFVFMHDDGLIRYFGQYQQDSEGVLYSNDSYMPWSERYPSYNRGFYGGTTYQQTTYNSYNFNQKKEDDEFADFRKWMERKKRELHDEAK